jgi:hypothetical protein
MIEVPEFITFEAMSRAIGIIRQGMESQNARSVREGQRDPTGRYRLAMEAGIRAARARDSRLLFVLDKGAEVLQAASQKQWGGSTHPDATHIEATEYQVWRNAYTQADQGGSELLIYQHTYAAVALLCGYVS